ncbi:hypothetical protein Tco_0167861 [Tanacetum coccineum]
MLAISFCMSSLPKFDTPTTWTIFLGVVNMASDIARSICSRGIGVGLLLFPYSSQELCRGSRIFECIHNSPKNVLEVGFITRLSGGIWLE